MKSERQSSPSYPRGVGEALLMTSSVVEKVIRVKGLTEFIVSSGAVQLAIGLVVGECIKNLVDSFTKAFISHIIALVGGKRHIEEYAFSVKGTSFGRGAFVGAFFETFLSLFFVYYFVLVPLGTYSSFKYGPLVKCPFCHEWIKDTARRCQKCCSWVKNSENEEKEDQDEEGKEDEEEEEEEREANIIEEERL